MDERINRQIEDLDSERVDIDDAFNGSEIGPCKPQPPHMDRLVVKTLHHQVMYAPVKLITA